MEYVVDINMPDFYERVAKLAQLLTKKYGSADFGGSTRQVFISKHCVFKLPRSPFCMSYNLNEYKMYKENGLPHFRRKRLARCRIIIMEGIPVCVMEKVAPYDYYNQSVAKRNRLPKWCYKLLDGKQFGYNRHNKLVVYDYEYDYRYAMNNNKFRKSSRGWVSRCKKHH